MWKCKLVWTCKLTTICHLLWYLLAYKDRQELRGTYSKHRLPHGITIWLESLGHSGQISGLDWVFDKLCCQCGTWNMIVPRTDRNYKPLCLLIWCLPLTFLYPLVVGIWWRFWILLYLGDIWHQVYILDLSNIHCLRPETDGNYIIIIIGKRFMSTKNIKYKCITIIQCKCSGIF